MVMSDYRYNPDRPGYDAPIAEHRRRSTATSVVLAMIALVAVVAMGLVFARQYAGDNKTAIINSANNPAATTGSASPTAASKPLPSGNEPTETAK
jgi:hypothetical protein